LDALKAEIAALKKPVSAAPAPGDGRTQPQPLKQPEGFIRFPKPKPSIDAFDDISAYTEAMADWKLEQRDWNTAQERRMTEYKETQSKIDTFVDNKIAEGFEKYGKEDFDGASNDVGTLLIQKAGPQAAQALIGFIMRQDNFADLTWELANNDAALEGVLAAGNVEDALLELRSLSRELKKKGQASGLREKETRPPIVKPNRVEAPGTGAKAGQSELQQLSVLRDKAEKSHLEEDRIAYFAYKESLRKKSGA
jgi:hypothetical protein